MAYLISLAVALFGNTLGYLVNLSQGWYYKLTLSSRGHKNVKFKTKALLIHFVRLRISVSFYHSFNSF